MLYTANCVCGVLLWLVCGVKRDAIEVPKGIDIHIICSLTYQFTRRQMISVSYRHDKYICTMFYTI